MPFVVHHMSEDPTIERFVPHVPRTNPGQPPLVWALDDDHEPLYWFPRDCPRVAAWPWPGDDGAVFRTAFGTGARRLHGIELGWLDRVRAAVVYRYTFDAAPFIPWADATGHWVCDHPVEPISREPLGDLLDLHVSAGIELRCVPTLWPLHDRAVDRRWDFSVVRMRNATPRDESV